MPSSAGLPGLAPEAKRPSCSGSSLSARTHSCSSPKDQKENEDELLIGFFSKACTNYLNVSQEQ
jgi:hypothetical protein